MGKIGSTLAPVVIANISILIIVKVAGSTISIVF